MAAATAQQTLVVWTGGQNSFFIVWWDTEWKPPLTNCSVLSVSVAQLRLPLDSVPQCERKGSFEFHARANAAHIPGIFSTDTVRQHSQMRMQKNSLYACIDRWWVQAWCLIWTSSTVLKAPLMASNQLAQTLQLECKWNVFLFFTTRCCSYALQLQRPCPSLSEHWSFCQASVWNIMYQYGNIPLFLFFCIFVITIEPTALSGLIYHCWVWEKGQWFKNSTGMDTTSLVGTQHAEKHTMSASVVTFLFQVSICL